MLLARFGVRQVAIPPWWFCSDGFALHGLVFVGGRRSRLPYPLPVQFPLLCMMKATEQNITGLVLLETAAFSLFRTEEIVSM